MSNRQSSDMQQSLPLDFPSDGEKKEEGSASSSDSRFSGADSAGEESPEVKSESAELVSERSDTVKIPADPAKNAETKDIKEPKKEEKREKKDEGKPSRLSNAPAAQVASRQPSKKFAPSSSKTQGSFLPGQVLQVARQDIGLSLDQVHMSTKIKKEAIQALEDGTVEALPSQVFAEAYIKRLCALYEIDSEEPVELFRKHYRMQKGEHIVPGEVLQDIQSGTQVNMKEEERVRRMVKIVLACAVCVCLLAMAIVKLLPVVSGAGGESAAAGPREPSKDAVAPAKALEVFLIQEPFNMTELSLPDHE